MFSSPALLTLALSLVPIALASPGKSQASSSSSGVKPTGPAPGDVFKAGDKCQVDWDPDTSGDWKQLKIELMTGDNFDMVHLTTVGTVDGTASPGSLSYDCPEVSPPAPIYFYQFTNKGDASTAKWTGRFTITGSDGKTVPAPESTQPDGSKIPWGTGHLGSGGDDSSSTSSSSSPTSSSISTSANATASDSSTSSDATSSSSGDDASSTSISATAGSSVSLATTNNGSPSEAVTQALGSNSDNSSDDNQDSGAGRMTATGMAAISFVGIAVLAF